MVFQEEFFEKVYFEKNQPTTKWASKITQRARSCYEIIRFSRDMSRTIFPIPFLCLKIGTDRPIHKVINLQDTLLSIFSLMGEF